jgi:hypothetical protein
MCAGAIYWAGIGLVVYGQTEKALKAQTGAIRWSPSAAPRRSDPAQSWRRPLRRPSKSFDPRARNARGGGGRLRRLAEIAPGRRLSSAAKLGGPRD